MDEMADLLHVSFVIKFRASILINKIILIISTVLYAMDGVGAIMPVENTMKKPQEFLGKPSVLLMAMGSMIVLYFIIGFFGYVRFGETTQDSITLNLPTSEWSAITGQAMIGFAILSNFGLSFYITTEILFNKISDKIEQSRNMSEIAIRTFILIAMVSVGLAVPDIGLFVSLIGSFYSSSCVVFVPALLEIIFLQSYGGFGSGNWKLWKNVLLMLFSLATFCTGMFLSIKGIVESYQ